MYVSSLFTFFGIDCPENRRRKKKLFLALTALKTENEKKCWKLMETTGPVGLNLCFFYERQEHRGARQPAVRDTRKQSQGPISVSGSVSVS
jgi:hypothetical protein